MVKGGKTLGITLLHADFILREHRYHPIGKIVHLLGRQTVHFELQTAIGLFEKHGITPVATQVEYDTQTIYSKQHSDQKFITDQTFFGMLGVEKVYAIDHSDFEGADILINLNVDLPKKHEESVDFLYGGSVCDNVFDPAMYIRNIAKLLKPGGRVLDTNVASNEHHLYMCPPPIWYFDYFVMNSFADCKLYVCEGSDNHIYLLEPPVTMKLVSDWPLTNLGVIFIAEKGFNSTWQISPTQDCYRGASEWKIWQKNLERIYVSKRPTWYFSKPSLTAHCSRCLPNRDSYSYVGYFAGLAQDDFDPNDSQGILVKEATYGWNCYGKPVSHPAGNNVAKGNATKFMRNLCIGMREVEWTIDCCQIGDPANSLAKDLYLKWKCPECNMSTHELYVQPEAHGKTIKIVCQKSIR